MKEGDMVTVFSLNSKIGTIVGFTKDEVIVMLSNGNFWKGSKRTHLTTTSQPQAQ